MKKYLPLIFVIFPLLISLYLYPQLPPTLATHWGIDGQVNGYSSKAVALFMIPVISFILFLLFRFLPSTDPYRKNFAQFKGHFETFIFIILGFLFYIYLLTTAWYFGYRFNIVQMLSPAYAVLFYFAAILMSVAKRNWFVGFRTPWTLTSDLVWNKTHQLGSKLFKLVALISFLGLFFPQLSLYLLIIPVLGVSLFTFIYSYAISKK